MIIQTTDDVKNFVRMQYAEGVNFNPDTDFRDYINIETREATFSEAEAVRRNLLNERCFEVCEGAGVSFYSLGLEIFENETEWGRKLLEAKD
jgi:hypothetical protein